MYFQQKMLYKLKIDDVLVQFLHTYVAGIFGTLVVPLTNSDTSFGLSVSWNNFSSTFCFRSFIHCMQL